MTLWAKHQEEIAKVISAGDFREPDEPANTDAGEVVIGTMTEREKALYTIGTNPDFFRQVGEMAAEAAEKRDTAQFEERASALRFAHGYLRDTLWLELKERTGYWLTGLGIRQGFQVVARPKPGALFTSNGNIREEMNLWAELESQLEQIGASGKFLTVEHPPEDGEEVIGELTDHEKALLTLSDSLRIKDEDHLESLCMECHERDDQGKKEGPDCEVKRRIDLYDYVSTTMWQDIRDRLEAAPDSIAIRKGWQIVSCPDEEEDGFDFPIGTTVIEIISRKLP